MLRVENNKRNKDTLLLNDDLEAGQLLGQTYKFVTTSGAGVVLQEAAISFV